MAASFLFIINLKIFQSQFIDERQQIIQTCIKGFQELLFSPGKMILNV